MMPAPREILHNRMIQCPGKPLMPINMEAVWDYLNTKSSIRTCTLIGLTTLSSYQPSTQTGSIVPFPNPITTYTSQALSSTRPQCPDAIPLRPRTSDTTGPGSTSALLSRTFSRQPLVPSHRRPLNLPACLSPIEHFPNHPNKFPKHTATPLTLAFLYSDTKASPGLALHHHPVPQVLWLTICFITLYLQMTTKPPDPLAPALHASAPTT